MFFRGPAMRNPFQEYAADLKRHVKAFKQGRLGWESFLTLFEYALSNMKLACAECSEAAGREGELEED